MTETILLVDDDRKMKDIVADVLRHEGFQMLTAMNGQDALKTLQANSVDLILLDIQLPDIDGLEVLKRCIRSVPSVPVIIISGFATIDKAVAATKSGAYDFLEKPLEPQRVLVTVKNALEKSRLEKSQKALVEDMMQRFGVVGVSEAIRKLYVAASRIAKLETPVLITGENGTGKELLARVIHQLSGRKTLVCLNCAAIPHELIESELFGHKKGSFTGALMEKVGKFQAADHGTLFLDEIGDMSLEMQAKVLRSLETKEVCMLGGNETVKVDVRFIAATNKTLGDEIRRGQFREDLFYRIRGVTLHISSLKERPEDIPVLANYFLESRLTEQLNPKYFSDIALLKLQEHDWPGNVRELKHSVDNLVAFSESEIIDHLQVITFLNNLKSSRTHANYPMPTDIGASEVHLKDSLFNSLRGTTESYEKNIILKTLRETGGNITHAAERLHIDRATLSKKIKRYGLKEE